MMWWHPSPAWQSCAVRSQKHRQSPDPPSPTGMPKLLQSPLPRCCGIANLTCDRNLPQLQHTRTFAQFGLSNLVRYSKRSTSSSSLGLPSLPLNASTMLQATACPPASEMEAHLLHMHILESLRHETYDLHSWLFTSLFHCFSC